MISSLTTPTDSQLSSSSKKCSSFNFVTETLRASSVSFFTGWARLFLTLFSDLTASKWQYFQFSSACSEAHRRFSLSPDVLNMSSMSFTFRCTFGLNLSGNILLNIMFCISSHIVARSRETCTSSRESTLFLTKSNSWLWRFTSSFNIFISVSSPLIFPSKALILSWLRSLSSLSFLISSFSAFISLSRLWFPPEKGLENWPERVLNIESYLKKCLSTFYLSWEMKS